MGKGPQIPVYTPKGDVKNLPEGATPVDFAYTVHSEIGDKCQGAKVNGKMVSLDYKLKAGEVVEIFVSHDKHKKPSRDWLQFVVTSFARRRIKRALAEKEVSGKIPKKR